MINERNMFLKRTTPRSPNNINDNTMPNVHSPLKISSQMVLSNDFSQNILFIFYIYIFQNVQRSSERNKWHENI